jgi:hypothetical protein
MTPPGKPGALYRPPLQQGYHREDGQAAETGCISRARSPCSAEVGNLQSRWAGILLAVMRIPKSPAARFFQALSSVAGMLMLVGLMGAAVSLGSECLFWLYFSDWPNWSNFQIGAPLPPTGFVDLDRSVARFLNSPLSAKLFVVALIGASAALLLQILSERADKSR